MHGLQQKFRQLPIKDSVLPLIKNLKFGKMKAANITALQYGMTFDSYEAQNLGFNSYDLNTQQSDTIYDYNDRMYRENVRLSLLHNWTFLVSPATKIEFRNFFNQQGSNQSILRTGSNFEEGSLVKSYAYRYQERTVYSGQLHGSHEINANRTKIDWTAAYSYSHSAEPDFRRIRTKKDISATSDSIPYQVVIAPSASTIDAGRFYSDLTENTGSGALDFEHALKSKADLSDTKIQSRSLCGIESSVNSVPAGCHTNNRKSQVSIIHFFICHSIRFSLLRTLMIPQDLNWKKELIQVINIVHTIRLLLDMQLYRGPSLRSSMFPVV
jgi:hypothetical protein